MSWSNAAGPMNWLLTIVTFARSSPSAWWMCSAQKDVAPAFVTCAPDRGQRYGFFTTRGADAPVVTVVNEAGLVIAPHTRWHKGVGFGGAMIVDVIHDLARRATAKPHSPLVPDGKHQRV